jgi:hypothetical protein
MQSGAHQKSDVCVNGSPHRPSLRSSFQSDAGQLRATGHHRSPAAASSSPIGRRQTALPYAVVIDQQATLFERLDSRFWKPCNRCDLTSRLIRSLARIQQMFKSDTVSFERQTIILVQPRHRAGTDMLASLIKMQSCLTGCSQPSFSVRVPRCGLISRFINVLFKSTKMVCAAFWRQVVFGPWCVCVCDDLISNASVDLHVFLLEQFEKTVVSPKIYKNVHTSCST